MDRKRLTITLKKDLLPLVDEVVDGTRIRNRSHAIEYLLTQTLGPKIKKAFILAGGRGIKMRPFTYELPKALIPVKGKPIAEYTVELLRDHQFREIYFVIGHLGEKIKAHFGDGTRYGLKINYIEQRNEEGTGAALRQIKKYVSHSPFLVIYGDTLIDINVRDFLESHQFHGGLATLAITSYDKPYEYGVIKLHGNRIVSFKEKPEDKKRISHLINTGLFVFNPEVFSYLPARGISSLEKDIFPKLVREGKLFGYLFEGQWFDVSTPEVYEEVLKEWRK